MKKYPLLLSALALVMNFASSETLDEQVLRKYALQSFPEYLELLTLPNVSTLPGDHLVTNAKWLKAAFEKRGFKVVMAENQNHPLVLGELMTNEAEKKTILYYLHFDGQPLINSQWSQEDPFKPVLKKRAPDGSWEEVNMSELMRVDFDPELRLFGRSTSDDKGPIGMFLASLDMIKAQGLKLGNNVKIILDSEEEISSPGISAVVEHHKDFLRSDAVVILDAAAHPSGRPNLVFGNRGVVTLTLTMYGPKMPLHSGHYGNYVPSPAMNLVQLLASMKDSHGRVTIPGYDSSTTLSADDQRVLHATGDDEALIKKRVGISQPDLVAPSYGESLQFPSLNIRGLSAGGVGANAANIIPKDAVAEIDIRTTQEANASYLIDLIKKHIEHEGFHILDHAPSDEDRAQYAKIVQFKVGASSEAARQSLDSPIRFWGERALKDAFAGLPSSPQPVLIRAMGATVPTYEIVSPLKIPFFLMPNVNADNNQHAFDENLRMGNYLFGMRQITGLLTTTYP
jgi:acetylornithine deacetylase/succinyl-diaminopimelate desuccinylase-like protein